MRERLEKFRAVCEECAHSNQDGYGGDPAFGRACTAWSQRRAVLKALDPDLASFNLDTMAGEHEGITAADRGLGMLADLDDVATRLRPEAPTLPADQLHPWVWDAARTFWDAALTPSPSSRRPRASQPTPSRRPGTSWPMTTS